MTSQCFVCDSSPGQCSLLTACQAGLNELGRPTNVSRLRLHRAQASRSQHPQQGTAAAAAAFDVVAGVYTERARSESIAAIRRKKSGIWLCFRATLVIQFS